MEKATQSLTGRKLNAAEASAGSVTLPIARYRFSFRVTEPFTAPEYAGSALRGVFGWSLRQLACVTRAPQCDGCAVINNCPYSQIFAPHAMPRNSSQFASLRQIPVPYIIEPPAWGKKYYAKNSTFAFEVVLFGNAIKELAIIILAWRRALLRGITQSEGKAELVSVEWLPAEAAAQSIYHEDKPEIITHQAIISAATSETPRELHLYLTTPLRLQNNGKPLGAKELSASLLARHLIRRVSMVQNIYMQQADYPQQALATEQLSQLLAAADALQEDRRIAWRDWSRYSSRQQQKMALGGVMGHWLIKNLDPILYPYFYLGQWLHLGKETVFGLGKYEIIDKPWNPSQEGPVQ